MASTRSVDQIGRVLGGRYRLLASIGRGASASVFLADDVRLRRRVAVKLLHPALAGDAGFLRRFEIEARVAAGLSHPNIMAVYDWGDDDGAPFLVCEYLAGSSLRAILDQGERLTPSQALLVGLQAARGLDYAHGRGLVHRDVKPANLLFDGDGRLRIADFGLARALAEAAWTEPAGAVLGTARYVAPEQVRGSPVDGRADVYALAVVLVEAVTGRVPFAADTTIATLMARLDRPLQVPEDLGALRPILVQAGLTDPAERPDAAALAAALDKAARELPRPGRLPLVEATAVDEVAVEPELDPTTIAASAPAAERVVASSPVTLPPTPPEPSPLPPVPETTDAVPVGSAPDTRPTRRRHRRLWLALATVVALASAAGGVAYAVVQARIPTHPLPSVEGASEAQAMATLRAIHVHVKLIHEFVDGTTRGAVVHQDPEPRDQPRVKEGSTVRLNVSDGPPPVAVPDLTRLTQDQATARLRQVGLAVGTVRTRSDEQAPAGTVLAWSGTGAQVPKGSAVDLTVSSGPAPRAISDFTGKSYDEAAAAFSAEGLVPVRADVFSDTVQVGQVVSTNPPAGQTAAKGSPVTVNVSKGPDLVTVPDVRGLSIDDATNKLQQAGLVVNGVFGPQRRQVVATDPGPGTTVHRGSAITLYTR